MDQSLPPSSSQASNGKNHLALGVIAVLAAASVIGGISYVRKPAPVEQVTNTESTSGSTNNGRGAPPFRAYKDGTFTAPGKYDTHAGPEEITITITLKDGIITDTQFQGTPVAKMSQRFMDAFSNNYKTLVIGKKIDEVHLDKVSGSSLTPIGFNNALEKIKQEAGQS